MDKIGQRIGLHYPKSKNFESLESLNSGWQFWMGRLNTEERDVARDNTFFFLPYVRALLFPETSHLTTSPVPATNDIMEDWVKLPVQQIAQRAAEHTTIRLTYKPRRLHELQQCEVVVKDIKAPLEICWIDLILFPQRIGFLLIKIKLNEEKPDVDRLNNVIRNLRHIQSPYAGFEMPTWRFPRNGNPVEVRPTELINYLLQGLVDELPAEKNLLGLDDFLHGPKADSPNVYTESPLGQTYGEMFHTYSYSCLDRKPEEPFTAEELAASEPLFSSPVNRLLYELATYSKTEDRDRRPAKLYLQRLMETGMIAFWDNWQAMALKDSITFLANYTTEFTQKFLPGNIESDYLPLYLFVLYQETRLSIMFGALMETEKNSGANLKRARDLWGEFLKFQNHYWFTEVTYKPQGAALYQIFQQALGVQPLYEKQNEEVKVLQDFYETKTQRQTNRMINFLTFVGVPVGILSQMYGSVLITKASWWDPILVMALTMAFLLVLWYLVFREK
jgi:hypothetical protein